MNVGEVPLSRCVVCILGISHLGCTAESATELVEPTATSTSSGGTLNRELRDACLPPAVYGLSSVEALDVLACEGVVPEGSGLFRLITGLQTSVDGRSPAWQATFGSAQREWVVGLTSSHVAVPSGVGSQLGGCDALSVSGLPDSTQLFADAAARRAIEPVSWSIGYYTSCFPGSWPGSSIELQLRSGASWEWYFYDSAGRFLGECGPCDAPDCGGCSEAARP